MDSDGRRGPKTPANPVWPGIAGLLVIVVLWGLPIGLLGATLPAAQVEQRRATSVDLPAEVTVGSRERARRVPVAVSVRYGPAPDARGQGAGTVTSVDVHVGDEVHMGQRLMSIDGRPVLALVGEPPLYRALQYGDHGADVLALSRLLAAAGYLDHRAVGSLFGRAIETGVKRLQSSAQQPESGVLEPRDAIYVPEGFGVVSEVSVGRGELLSDSWPMLVGAAPIERLSFESSSDGTELPASAGDDVGGISLVTGDRLLAMQSLRPEGDELISIERMLREGAEHGSLTEAGEADERGTTRRFEGALVQLGDTSRRGSLPATAVFTSSSGTSCVFSRSSRADEDARATRVSHVDVDGTGVGRVFVDESLIGRTVLRDPSTLPRSTLSRCK